MRVQLHSELDPPFRLYYPSDMRDVQTDVAVPRSAYFVTSQKTLIIHQALGLPSRYRMTSIVSYITLFREAFEKYAPLDLGVERVLESPWVQRCLGLVLFSRMLVVSAKGPNESIDAPIIRPKKSFVLRFEFFSNAREMTDEGYNNVLVPRAHCVKEEFPEAI